MLKNTNKFLAIYEKLNSGNAAERFITRPNFPLLIDVELTNHCNFSCRMCETGMHTSPRARGYMKQEIFEKILQEAAAHQTALRFIRWGEPTLHPHWLEWMLRAKQMGLLVHFNTNGSKLDKDKMIAIVEGGIDSIKFSFQGVDKNSYLEMRRIDFFDELLEKMKYLKTIRGNMKVPYLQISTTITNEPLSAVEAFKLKALEAADYVNIGITKMDIVNTSKLNPIDRAIQNKLRKRQRTLIRPKACAEVFAKISIDWDGNVTSCCADNHQAMVVGSIAIQSITEIWNGDKQRHHQWLLSENNFNALFPCKKCFVGRDI